jgi:hypothetical protein
MLQLEIKQNYLLPSYQSKPTKSFQQIEKTKVLIFFVYI